MDLKVTQYLDEASLWQEEMKLMRQILLDSGLEESYKWKKPCYSYQTKNLVIIQPFKHYCSLGFFEGALLKDSKNILVKPGENTQGGRQMRFNNTQEILQLEKTLKSYLNEAIELEKSGVKFEISKPNPIEMPEELESAFSKDGHFKKAFYALTPGRQRAYLMYFSAAKQSATRSGRIENYKNRILMGKGFNDCVCGHSKRMPNCDGSHKYF